MHKDLELGATQLCLDCDQVKPLEQGEAVIRYGSFIEFTCYDCKQKATPHKITITFTTDRTPTEEEFLELMDTLCLQVEEPTTLNNEEHTYKTSAIRADLERGF